MKIIFAPDYSEANPYQRLLVEALRETGIEVDFLSDYRRLLPLARSLRKKPFDLLHLHWPEAYFRQRQDVWDRMRILRFSMDLKLALGSRPLVVTAHNLMPHTLSESDLVRRSLRQMYRRTSAIIAHSQKAADKVVGTFDVPAELVSVIPHGDLAAGDRRREDREHLRVRLGWDRGQHCLIFGSPAPYKRIEEVVAWWGEARPEAKLWIIGKSWDSAYESHLQSRFSGIENVAFVFERLDDTALFNYIVAADAVILNHRSRSLTSGAACLVRSLDVPLLLPNSLVTVDLDEPHPRVFRFDGFDEHFSEKLSKAIQSDRTQNLSADWKKRTAWKLVSQAHAKLYEEACRRVSGEAPF